VSLASVRTLRPGRRSPLTVRILDVGQGDGIYITNGASRVILDGRPSGTPMANLISEFGLSGKTINLLILTRGHSDHLMGLREFFKATYSIQIPIFLENKDASTATYLTQLRDFPYVDVFGPTIERVHWALR
jgi:metal-dependent hydrolase (beta-lactamase superfamily II)